MKRPRLNLLFKPAALASLTVMFAVAGCDREGSKIRVETNDVTDVQPASPPLAAPAAMPSSMPAGLPAPDNSGLPKLKYSLPDGWKEKIPSTMRVASFDISQNGKSVDVSVVPLGGSAGGDLANVNRWLGQLNQPPLDDDAIQKMAEKVMVAGQPAELYDLLGTASDSNPARIISVILHRDDTVWFFKMDGDATLVEQQKPAIISFLQSLQFDAPDSAPVAAPPADMSQLPPNHPAISDMAAPTEASPAKPAWIVPDGWQAGPPSQFLVANFIIAGAGKATAGVNVCSLTGDGGGVVANVNRWRGQLGLQPAADILTSPLDASGGKAQMVDFNGTDARTGQPARLVGVIVPAGAQTWFYKLMGDPDLVAQQKDAFIRVVQSAQYTDAH